MSRPPQSSLNTLRLTDRVGPELRLLFVGINPGVRSALIGHHFAGYSNRFWKLLFDAGLTPELLRAEDDTRLLESRFGITNLVPRPTPGIDTLRADEYLKGLIALRRKIRRLKPEAVVLIGVTLYRTMFGVRSGTPVTLGRQVETLEGAAVFVVPNPSGRNANFSYGEMLEAFRSLHDEGSRPKALDSTPKAQGSRLKARGTKSNTPRSRLTARGSRRR